MKVFRPKKVFRIFNVICSVGFSLLVIFHFNEWADSSDFFLIVISSAFALFYMIGSYYYMTSCQLVINDVSISYSFIRTKTISFSNIIEYNIKAKNLANVYSHKAKIVISADLENANKAVLLLLDRLSFNKSVEINGREAAM